MGRLVTAIRPQGDQRLAVELDGGRWVTLDPLTAARLGIESGRELDDATIADAEAAAREERAMARAARMVGRRSHARADLERRVARADGDAAARHAAERLAALGALDDERHAADLAAHRLRGGWGPLRIAHDLAADGVDGEVARAAIAALDRAEVDAAARIALGGRSGAAGWQRLAARGFDEGTAERLLGVADDA